MRELAFAAAIALAASACGDNLSTDHLQGGDETVFDRTRDAFTHSLPSLDADQLEQHNLGHGPFAFEWMPPQLGPLFNNKACSGCHFRNGRGESSVGHDVFGSQALVRISLETGEPQDEHGPVPVPGFGLQLQDHATAGLPEVVINITWIDLVDYFDDGDTISLHEPRFAIMQPDGSRLPNGVHTSYRQAPPLIGMELLDAVPEADIVALADPDDADGDGVSGRPNYVWNPVTQRSELGRFGHKANVPNLEIQVAGAFANDMGLTNLIFPEADGVTRDVNDQQLVDTTFFVASLAVPAAAPRDDQAERGRELFDEFGCATCHVPTLHTGFDADIPQLRDQEIHPYTDLLLHDLGDDLTDSRQDFLADGIEWRTPPLWGIGLTQVVSPNATFLHDGRARTLAEAIMWHGGEGEGSRTAFRAASRDDRDALIAFLQTL